MEGGEVGGPGREVGPVWAEGPVSGLGGTDWPNRPALQRTSPRAPLAANTQRSRFACTPTVTEPVSPPKLGSSQRKTDQSDDAAIKNTTREATTCGPPLPAL